MTHDQVTGFYDNCGLNNTENTLADRFLINSYRVGVISGWLLTSFIVAAINFAVCANINTQSFL